MKNITPAKPSPYNAVEVPQLTEEELRIFNSIALEYDEDDAVSKRRPRASLPKPRSPGKVKWKKTGLKPKTGGKKAISIRMDADVLEWFKAQGKGYQSHIGAVLRAYMKARSRKR